MYYIVKPCLFFQRTSDQKAQQTFSYLEFLDFNCVKRWDTISMIALIGKVGN